jgi:hypothetical protein
VLDPPDEIIPPKATAVNTFSADPVQMSPASHQSRLSNVVSAFSADGVWRLRTFLSLLCALGLVWLEMKHQLVQSGVVLMGALDSALLFYAMLAHHPSKCTTLGNPLGRVALLKMPLMMLHPASVVWFDTVCLLVLLGALILRDILLMIFTSVVVRFVVHNFLEV